MYYRFSCYGPLETPDPKTGEQKSVSFRELGWGQQSDTRSWLAIWRWVRSQTEPGEHIEDALRREVREELGIELLSIAPLFFKDDVLDKTLPDRTRQSIHMVFLVSRCVPVSGPIRLNEEFTELVWADATALAKLLLNPLTRDTLVEAGYLPAASAAT